MLEPHNERYFLLALATLSAIYFVAVIHEALSPLVLFLLVIFLLYPLRDSEYGRRLLWSSVILFFIWFVTALSGLLSPFIISFTLAYLFDPMVNWLCKKRVPRSVAAFFITMFGIGGLALLIILVVPEVSRQIMALLGLIKILPERTLDVINALSKWEFFDRLNLDVEMMEKQLSGLVTSRVGDIGKLTADFATSLALSIPKVISTIMNIIFIPILSFYFLNDFETIRDTLYKILPNTYTQTVHRYVDVAGTIFKQYLRGYLIIMTLEIILYTIIFSLIGIKYPLVLAIIAGAMLFVPYIGIFISVSLTALVIALGNGEGQIYLFTGLTYLTIQSVENFFLIPKIVGSRVQLNPILLFLAIVLFGYFIGFVGILIAVPVSAFLVAIFRHKVFNEPFFKIVSSNNS
ncbi:protein of unknown function UPF0118 [Chloroherpeton thalassium ATCC 35110]|uniref:Permease n=1 Tax=Chloroherpeton thalassium (strain ATCC 35110 / GB-78) TaxID=517418 RepID=B3QUQ4_CHLT3|nr:AI-2E family transporter [Chloroherpeton thalassium]ACF12960.1 protein of unknown function UPF0118 [Chloroherpeton thalassium ATCC 35110]